MKTGKAGLDLIKSFEGLRLDAYKDSVGTWTIGYGHTQGVKPGDAITPQQAEAYLQSDIVWAEKAVNTSVKVPLTQNQFDALVSFTFNLGAGAFKGSTLLKKLNAGDYAAVPAEIRKWDHAGGVKLAGLTRRREAEAALWLQKGTTMSVASNPVTNLVTKTATAAATAALTEIGVPASDAGIAVTQAVSNAVTHPDVKAAANKVDAAVNTMPDPKPWYASAGVWGGIIAAGVSIASTFGLTFDPELVNQIGTVIPLVITAIGGLIAIWGRVTAKRPIG